MFKKNYGELMEKFSPDEKLIEKAVTAAEAEEKPKVIPLRRRWVPAVAAVLVFALVLTALLIPKSANHSFALTASAAENTPLRDDSYVEIGALKWNGGGYSPDHIHEEVLTDISVSGEDIESVTYRMNDGKIGLPDDCPRLIDSAGKEDRVYDSEGNSFSVNGMSYYDSVTCAYADPFTPEDGMEFTIGGDVGVDFDGKICARMMDVRMKLSDVENGIEDQTLTEDEVYAAFFDYYNEVLKDARMLVTVTYTDGSEETQEVGFAADCTVTPVHRQFHAFAYDEDGEPYAVTDMDSDYVYAFEIRDDLDWDGNEDYNAVKHLFNDENMIEFDDFEIDITLSARIENGM